MTTVLLGMDDATADIFRQKLYEYSDGNLDILEQNVPIFHNSKRALELLNPMPDIYLIAMNHIRFDTSDSQKEFLRGLANLKMNSQTSQVRIAVQADLTPTDPFLRQLALVQISDIFSGTSQNPHEFNLHDVAKQLSKAPNLKNVYKYLTLNKSVESLNTENILSNSPSDSSNTDQVQSLKKIVKILKEQNDELSRKNGVNTVPREDYEEVVAELNKIMSSGLTSDNFKGIVQKIAKIEQKQKVDNRKLRSINNRLNNTIVELTSQVPTKEPLNDNYEEVEMLRRKVADFERKRRTTPSPNSNGPKVYKTNTSSPRGAPKPKARPNNNNFVKIFGGLLAFLVIFGIAFGTFYSIHQSHNAKTQQTSKPSFSSLVKSGSYDKAAMYYPKKAVKAEDAMMADKDLTAKGTMAERISKYSDNDVIKFDLDYFNGDYDDAVDVYRNSSEPELTQLSKERRVMAAYALMKTGNLADAKSVAKPLNNETLNKRIAVYSKFYNANKILNNKITNGHLSSKEEKKAREQIKENQEAMDKL